MTLVGLTLLAAPAAHALTDNFDTAHDYSGGNVTGTIWDGIRYNEGDISGVVADASTTTAGELHLASANGNWSGAGNDGLLLYINVSGDFVAEVQATSASSGNYNGVGLMARLADPAADGDAGEDWVFLSYSTRFSQNRVRKVNNNSNTEVAEAGEQPFLQIERLGDDFIFRRKANAGDAWAQIDLVTRADLNGLPLQVGIWQADFDSTADSGTLDNFSLTTPPTITTTAASDVTTNAATLNGNLSVAGNPAADVYVFYGTSNGVSTKSSWETSVLVDDDAIAGAKSHAASALSPNTTYYYRYYASNSVAEVWGSTASFTTLEPPTISTAGTLFVVK